MIRETEKKNLSNGFKNLFKTNPIESKAHEKLFASVKKFQKKNSKLKSKAESTSKLVDYIYSMNESDLYSLLSYNDELVRSIAIRAYVDCNPADLSVNFKAMLKNRDELVRHSAVMGLSYLNAPEYLDLLVEAVKDNNEKIKLAALGGIVDIAQEYNSAQAKNVLKLFASHESQAIREFVSDELSILI